LNASSNFRESLPRLLFDMRDLGAVLDHEEPLPHPACDQTAIASKTISATPSGVGAIDAGGAAAKIEEAPQRESALWWARPRPI